MGGRRAARRGVASARDERSAASSRARHALADRLVLSRVRALFGGRLSQAITGAAPIEVEVLEFFDACGVPVMEAYGLSETSAAVSPTPPPTTASAPWAGCCPTWRRARRGRRAARARAQRAWRGYLRDPQATAALDGPWLRTGDMGRLDAEGHLFITGRKKDLIITAGARTCRPPTREPPQGVPLGLPGGRRRGPVPYLVALLALDADELEAFAGEHGRP